MGEVDGIRNGITVSRIDRDKFVAFTHLDFAKNLQIFARASLLADAGLLNQFDKGKSAAIQNREFDLKAVEINAVKNNSRSGRTGKNPHGNGRAAVESDSTAFHG